MKNQIVLLLLLLSFNTITAQLSSVIGKTDYPFWINLPEQAVLDKKAPIIIFLHGRSLSGTDLNKVKRYGILKAVEKKLPIPAIIIAPQVTSGSAWNPEKILNVLKYVQKNYPTDSTRVYVCGMSLGGYGTFDFAGKYPDEITAAVAICGGGNAKYACALGSNPLWVIHGDKDMAVPISESKNIVAAIKSCKPNADLTFSIIPGGSHGSVEDYFRHMEIYNWMLQYSKKDALDLK